MNQDSIIYWLGLARIDGLGIRSAHRLLEHVGSAQAAFMDSILSGVALPPPRIMQTLLELEMNGMIRQLPGKNFIRKL